MFGMRVYNQDLKERINRYLLKEIEKNSERDARAMIGQLSSKENRKPYASCAQCGAALASHDSSDLTTHRNSRENERLLFDKIERERAKRVFARQRGEMPPKTSGAG